MESISDFYADRALLEWQIELGVTEAIGDAPVDRYALPETGPAKTGPAKRKVATPAAPVAVEPAAQLDPVQKAKIAAQSAGSLDDLQQALGALNCAN